MTRDEGHGGCSSIEALNGSISRPLNHHDTRAAVRCVPLHLSFCSESCPTIGLCDKSPQSPPFSDRESGIALHTYFFVSCDFAILSCSSPSFFATISSQTFPASFVFPTPNLTLIASSEGSVSSKRSSPAEAPPSEPYPLARHVGAESQ